MQELRSTDILDKEIQNDARKKAETILSNSKKDAEDIINSLKDKISQAKLEKETFYSEKLESLQKDLNASIPLEKQRFKVSYIQDSLLEAMNEYFSAFTEDNLVKLCLKQLDGQEALLEGKEVQAYVYGFETSAVEKQLKAKIGKMFKGCTKTEFGKILPEEDLIQIKKGIILEANDKSFRLRLTLSNIISRLLDKNRQELCGALFGANV